MLEDDNDEQERPQLVHRQHAKAKLPLAPNFKPSASSRKPNQLLPPPNRDLCQIMENPACDCGNDNTLPGSDMLSTLSQFLSTNPSSKYSITMAMLLMSQMPKVLKILPNLP